MSNVVYYHVKKIWVLLEEFRDVLLCLIGIAHTFV